MALADLDFSPVYLRENRVLHRTNPDTTLNLPGFQPRASGYAPIATKIAYRLDMIHPRQRDAPHW